MPQDSPEIRKYHRCEITPFLGSQRVRPESRTTRARAPTDNIRKTTNHLNHHQVPITVSRLQECK